MAHFKILKVIIFAKFHLPFKVIYSQVLRIRPGHLWKVGGITQSSTEVSIALKQQALIKKAAIIMEMSVGLSEIRPGKHIAQSLALEKMLSELELPFQTLLPQSNSSLKNIS